ncbi:conserved hypothetical protein [Trichinella spiralis]|uniref:hypothetical protein n=1 Tax=Trichinella spiralis TaxID=6334 RepID=UPI0001EFEE17|nr:conserved hypothetical protein [Trichinella spiralis]
MEYKAARDIIVIWTASTGEIYADYGPFSTSVTDADWKDDSTFSVCFDNGTLFHCSPTDPFVMSTFEGHQMRVNMIRWDPAGKMMASCSDDRLVRIWRLNSQTYDFSLCGHTAEVDVLCWHDTDRAILARPGSDILASSGLDNRIMLWNVKVGGMLNEIENDDQKRIYELAWNRNGEKLAIAKADGLSFTSNQTSEIWSTPCGNRILQPTTVIEYRFVQQQSAIPHNSSHHFLAVL